MKMKAGNDADLLIREVEEELGEISRSRLKMLREEKGVSAGDLAAMLGCTEQEYLAYEADGGIKNAADLIRLHEYYQVSCDYLLGLTDIRS